MASPMRFKNRAFTLIELLIVVAIIAILAAIAVPNFLEAQVRSKVSRERSDMRSVATALEAYAVDNNHYPATLGSKLNGGGSWTTDNLRNGYGTIRVASWRVLPNAITTPIAYITSIFPDVFRINNNNVTTAGDVDANKPYSTPNPTDLALIYQNIADYITNDSPPTGTNANYNQNDLNDYGPWRLMSIGPDRTYNQIGTSSIVPLGWIYDPTNGTISGGMIVRTQHQTQVIISHTVL